jgi:predicted nuclease of predicted toxin-antitoxin system
MKILIEECAPRDLKLSLAAHGHECYTVQEVGWSGKKNGELLALAERRFEVLVTLDKNLQFQQKLSGRNIAVLLIGARSNDLDDILPHIPECLSALHSIQPGQIVRVGWNKRQKR